MKTRNIILLLLILFAFGNSFAQKARFFIKPSLEGSGDLRQIAGAVAYFVTQFDNEVKEIYPCSVVIAESDVGVLLGHERDLQLLGSGTGGNMESISNALGCDYLINLEIGFMFGNTSFVSASLIPFKTKFPILHVNAHSPFSSNSGDQVLSDCDEVAKKLVDGMKHIEICPFKGELKVRVVSETKKDTTIGYPVFCNGADQQYQKRITVNKYADNNWDLQKVALIRTSGTIKYESSDTTTLVEEDNCYKCKSGRRGGRTYTEKFTKYAIVNGLSQESQEKGLPIDSARIELKFKDDDTYFVFVEATSRKGDLKESKEVKAEGTCDVIQPKKDTLTEKANVPLKFPFGPYQGTSKEKRLKEKPDPIVKTDPVTGEKTTYYLEFDLKRD